MKIEEFGKENDKAIVLLHGAFFVHSFGRQYPLAEDYHIMVPHIMGFGNEACRTFEAGPCVKELAAFIKGLNQKVMLVGFSLGAQLAFKLVSEYEELFDCAILVSPWLIKDDANLEEMAGRNIKQLASLKNKWRCNMIAIVNGMAASAPRREFVEQSQSVTAETIRNVTYNGITLESVPSFANVRIPVIAIAGGKEDAAVRDSVKRLAEINPNCRYEIWEKAAHNIPPLFASRFNALIRSTYVSARKGKSKEKYI